MLMKIELYIYMEWSGQKLVKKGGSGNTFVKT